MGKGRTEQSMEFGRNISNNKGQQRNSIKDCKCVFYSEIDKFAVQTYNKNFGENHNPTDITKIRAADIPDFDILCGGFPCQAFSIAGKRGGFQDTRGTLFFEIARIIKAKRPKLIFLENVKGLLNHNKGETFSIIIQTISELGYNVQWMVLNSKFFGVPQNRERVFIIGSLRGECKPEILPFGWDDRKITKGLQEQHYTQTLTTRTGSTAKQQTIINHSLYPRSSKTNKGGSGHLTKMDGASYCVDTGNMQGVEISNQIRRLTPIECERLQGFPDNWTEGVSDTQRYKQMGNAVTVNVIEAIAGKLI